MVRNDRFSFLKRALLVAILGSAFIGIGVMSGFGQLPDNTSRTSSHAIAEDGGTRLGAMARKELKDHETLSGVFLLGDGLDAFTARALLAREAERTIDVQYYMFHYDTVGKLLIYELASAADRGVRVRLLIDDMYGDVREDLWTALDSHPNFEVRLFNPFVRDRPRIWQFLTRLKDVNYRMHSKSYTVDNAATIVGGRNIGDQYFDADPDLAFSDLDVLGVGPVVPEVSAAFDEYWNSPYAYPASTLIGEAAPDSFKRLAGEMLEFFETQRTSDYIQALQNSALAKALAANDVSFTMAPAKIIHDSSQKKDRSGDWQDELLISQLAPYIMEAREEFILVSPYFVPGERAMTAFCDLTKKGVRVRILTNSLVSNDVPAVHAGYVNYRERLLRCGVELYELDENIRKKKSKLFTWLPGVSKSSLHAKTMVIDKKIIFVGSFNFDQRSLHINNEIGMLFQDEKVGLVNSQAFDENIEEVAFRVEWLKDHRGNESLRWRAIEDGHEVYFDNEPYASWRLRAAVWVMKYLPIESML
jgi:putative cardiolipin synthase